MSSVNENFKSLADLDENGLNEAYQAACKETFELNLKHNSGQLKETHLLKANRRKIARIKTLFSQKRGTN